MTHAELRSLALAILAAIIAILLSACAGAPIARTRSLPNYEMPIAKTDFQSVRTTAYTHTEADHRQFTNHNALGGELHAASTPNRRAENTARPTLGLEDQSGYHLLAYSSTKLQPFDDKPSKATAKTAKTSKGKKTVSKKSAPRIGSAAADWSRWPAGTTFRLVSTGQIYKIEDYGWALSGRNTIDLYMATPRDVNTWGVRQEQIQVLHWGDPTESFRLLAPHQEHLHIKRMILEMQGHSDEAATLR